LVLSLVVDSAEEAEVVPVVGFNVVIFR